MTIDDFRKEYPQYDDWPDKELATRLHKKYYPDMSFGEFSKQVGYKAEPEAKKGGRLKYKHEIPWEKMADPNLIGAPQDVRHLEAAPALLSGMAGMSAGGLAGIGELTNIPDEDELDLETVKPRDIDRLQAASDTLERIAPKLAYEPRTEKGRITTEALAYPFEKLHEVAQKGGELSEKFIPGSQPYVASGIEALPFAIPFVKKPAVRAAKSLARKSPVRVKLAKSPEALAKTPESKFLSGEFEERFVSQEAVNRDIVQSVAVKAGDEFSGGRGHMEAMENLPKAVRDKIASGEVTAKDGFMVVKEGDAIGETAKFLTREEVQKKLKLDPKEVGDLDAADLIGKRIYPEKKAPVKDIGDLTNEEIAKMPMEERVRIFLGEKATPAEIAEVVKKTKIITEDLKNKQYTAERMRISEAEYEGVNGATLEYMMDDVRRGAIERGAAGHRIGSSYPQWFRDINKKTKLSKKEFETLQKKVMGNKELTEKQMEKWAYVEDAAKDIEAVTPELWSKEDFPVVKEINKPYEAYDIKTKTVNRYDPVTGKSTVLFSGVPPHAWADLGSLWTKYPGHFLWDYIAMQKIPKFLERIPGGKTINRAFDYNYRGDLPNTPEYIKRYENMNRYQAIGREYAIDLGNQLMAFPEDAQMRMGEYIRGEKVKLSGNEAVVADKAKNILEVLGRQAVDVGLLSEDVFFKNVGRYMPRLYSSMEYRTLLNKYGLTKPNRLKLDRFKKRKDIPKEVRKEMGEILTPGYPVAKGITQLTHDIEMARFFNGIADNPAWAWKKRVAKPLETDIRKWIAQERKAKRPLDKIIKDANARFSDQNARVYTKTGKKGQTLIRIENSKPIPKGFIKIEGGKKLGALDKSYVHPEILEDLRLTVKTLEMPERVWRKLLGFWKFGKVIISPKTHARNLFSNSILAHLGGMPMPVQPVYLSKAAKSIWKKDANWKLAKREGLLDRTWTNAELRELFDNVKGGMDGLAAGSTLDTIGVAGKALDKVKKSGRWAAKVYEFEEQWFKVAKMIHNIERRKMRGIDAVADAEKWLFNYAKVTKFQDKYRTKWYGAPFATFTFKALPRIAEAAVKYPWRFALPAGMIYGLEKAAMSVIGDTKRQFEAKKELRPTWQKGSFAGIVPNFARTPLVDDYGREHFLNLSYILPWGDIAEGGSFMGIPGSLRPMSQPFVSEFAQQVANQDLFWKEQIVKDSDVAGLTGAEERTGGEVLPVPWTEAGRVSLEARGKHLFSTMAPTPLIDITKGAAAYKGTKPDYHGRFRDPRTVAADVFAGVKMYPVDYNDQIVRKIQKVNPERGFMAAKINSEIVSFSIKRNSMAKAGKSTEFYDNLIESKQKQLEGMAKQTQKLGKTIKKFRGE